MDRFTRFLDGYNDFFTKFIHIDKSLHQFNVDFSKPWWYIFSKVKSGLIVVFYYNFFIQTFMSLRITAIGYILAVQRYDFLWYLLFTQLFFDFTSWFMNRYWVTMYENIMLSVKTSAFNQLMTVDPIYHATKSSGQIIGKVDRGIQAYNDFISLVTETTGPFLVRILVSCGVLFTIDSFSGFLGLGLVLALMLVNVILILLNTKAFVPKVNLAEDVAKQNFIEPITQFGYVRSTFSTDFVVNKFSQSLRKYHIQNSTRWRAFNHIVWPLWILFVLGVFWLLFHAMDKVVLNPSQTSIYVASLATYILMGNDIWLVGYDAERIARAVGNIKDMYKFVREFGQQTYPVLESSETN